jgi:hypothetical protein
VEAAQFNKFVTGKCVFVNPGYSTKEEGSIPLITRLTLPRIDLEADDWCRSLWSKVRDRLIAHSSQKIISDAQSQIEIANRMQIAETFFPPPPEASGGTNNFRIAF